MYTFHIPKMSCGGCVNSIKNAIKKVDDEAVVEANLTTKTVEIKTTTPENEIIRAMLEAGYKPD